MNKGHDKRWWDASLSAYAKEVRKAHKEWEVNKADKNLKLAYLQK